MFDGAKVSSPHCLASCELGLETRGNMMAIRIDTKSGHGAGKPLAKTIEENSEVFAFIAWNLGAKFIQ
ncbi:hypothetical protein Gpo141_00004555 [Globisporangium polare]